MGSTIIFNDTLQITAEQGFPVQLLDLERHQANAIHFEFPLSVEKVDKEEKADKPTGVKSDDARTPKPRSKT